MFSLCSGGLKPPDLMLAVGDQHTDQLPLIIIPTDERFWDVRLKMLRNKRVDGCALAVSKSTYMF